MKFQDLIINNSIVGTYFETQKYRVIFGNRFGTQDVLQTQHKKISLLKQIHCNKVVQSNDLKQEADSHFSASDRVGVVTADCIPVLFYFPESNIIAACHAGWRGLKDQIIKNTLAITKENASNIQVFVGPHIRRKNFEVHNDVADQIALSVTTDLNLIYPHVDSQKKYVDLTKVTEAQLISLGVNYKNIYFDSVNTFESKNHASYRRDGPKAGRQISTVELI